MASLSFTCHYNPPFLLLVFLVSPIATSSHSFASIFHSYRSKENADGPSEAAWVWL
ncbi:hypothetical protein E2C01_068036 [Portunus trituberculatus]|uniref:Uncharacterized protein n=1 Tax=Portunus trituberculatus TaxID=210409 RepID=A0A5B7HMN7_PORTR|nr:hypothetical protein [Portunus trituberculatus]